MDVEHQGVLLDYDAASAYTGMNKRTLRAFVVREDGPVSALIGRRRYFRRADLDKWLDERFAAASNN